MAERRAGADPAGVAIVGMGALFPGAGDLDTYWRNIVGGVDAITDVPAERWEAFFYDPESTAPDRVYCHRGGFVDDYATFDAAAFGIMPVTVEAAEPDQLIALKVAAAAIADAGGEGQLGDPQKVGVIVGRGGYFTPGMARFDQRVRVAQQLVESLRELVPGITEAKLDEVKHAFQDQLGPSRPEAAIDLVPNLAASRIANRLDLQGPAYTVDAACASSLVAVDQAVAELRSRRCDAVVAGGVHHCHDVAFWTVFSQLRALSPSEAIRPFDRSADGLLIGEGTGMVVLKRLADAERDGDRVYAVIRGTGVASDGRASSVMKPRVAGQLLALERAWSASGLDPATVGLIEAHGTATPVGDAAELDTLAQFFGPADAAGAGGRPASSERGVLGSVKSMIGHTMPAAGAAALIKTALALHHGVLPPTLHCDEPHERLADTRFRTLAESEDWGGAPERRVAGVNAFGFGGINAHLVLEAAPGAGAAPVSAVPTRSVDTSEEVVVGARPLVPPTTIERVVLLEGASADDLLAQLDDPAILVDRDDTAAAPAPGSRPADAATDRTWRLAMVAPDARRLELARKVVARGTPWHGRNDVWFSNTGLLAGGGKVAFLFPGVEPEFDPHVADVADHFGLPLGPLAEDGHAGQLGRHGAGIIALGRLLDAALGELGIRPDVVAGHSIGEWNAMIAAHLIPADGVDDFIDSVDTDDVDVPGVVFAALGCGADAAGAAVGDLPDIVVSHDNCPHQSIVCGSEASVGEVIAKLRSERILAQLLPFRSGFHSPMLAPYVAPVRQATARVPLQAPAVPVWSATTVAPYPDDPEAVRDLVIRHLLEPVHFRQLALRLHDEGVRVFVQVGVGSLVNFLDDTLKGREHLAVVAAGPRHAGLDQLRRVAAALWTEGAQPRFDRLPSGAASTAATSASGGSAAGAVAPHPVGSPVTAAVGASASDAAAGSVAPPVGTGTAAPAPAVGAGMPDAEAASTATAPTATASTAAAPTAVGSPDPSGPGAATAPGVATPGAAPPDGAAAGRVPGPAERPGVGVGVPLHLGAPLIHLAAGVHLDLAPAGADATALAAGDPSLAGHPVFAEFDAGLREVGPALAEVVGAWRDVGPSQVSSGSPWVATAPGGPAASVPAAGSSGGAGPAGGPESPVPAPASADGLTEVRTLSMDAMPFLIDHRFYRQRDGWDDVSDLFPVVPMTCTLQIFQEVASRLMPGKVPIGLEHVRALRWLAVEPPIDVTINATVTGPDRVRVSVEGFSRGTVVFADTYPEPPAADTTPLEGASVWGPTAWDLYNDRWAFHGPQYQGVTEIGPLGPAGVQGTIEALPAPGALLDGAGQLVGHWVAMHTEVDRLALPSVIERIRFFGPHPPPGDRFGCTVRVGELTDAFVRADLEMVSLQEGDRGRVWCQIESWQDTRFDTDDVVFPMLRDPDQLRISEQRPGGWFLATEHWANSASRELMMRRYLNHRERPTYEGLNPKAQRQWLLGRIAVKDAVRQWLWDHGAGPVFPAEVTVSNDDDGRPQVDVDAAALEGTALEGTALEGAALGGAATGAAPPAASGLRVSLAHTEWAAVALVAGPDDPAPGIDIEVEAPRHERFASLALTDTEAAWVPAEPGPERDLALTRFWTVKEAVGKAGGAGLEGRPRAIGIDRLEGDRAWVGTPGTEQVQVDTEVVAVGDDGPRYVVSWTANPGNSW